METTMDFDLYGEATSAAMSTISDSPLTIDIDLNWSLMEMIKAVRDSISEKPETFPITLYFVSGKTGNENIVPFIDYLLTLKNSLQFVFRGYIHADFVKLFVSYPNTQVLISKDSMFIYDTNNVHSIMKHLIPKQELFRKFLTRFVEQYHKYDSPFYLDITELETLGFNIQKF